MKQKNLNSIRNFSIIAHVSHGKSTLADRFLELTETVPKEKMRPQYLDSMELEKEKGITIKMHPCRLIYRPEIKDSEYLLNLIDTPGHIDFSYEISRALACVEGAILLVDATKGIQAQTLFNLSQTREQNLKIIGAVNKIDSPQAQISQTKQELQALLNVPEEEIFAISAKEGTGVKELLKEVVKKIPPPITPSISQPASREDFKALIFDSKYDSFSGVVAFVRVFTGEIKKGDSFYLLAQRVAGQVKEIGFFSPELTPLQSLKAGEIGYIKTGIKTPGKVRVGETIAKNPESQPLSSYKEPQPVLFLSLYPENADDFENLKQSLEKLKLTDPSLDFQLESKTVLGRGFRIGFLGSLQAEITLRRLKEEFNLDIISTMPEVVFKIFTRDNQEIEVSSPDKWPEISRIKEIQEPWAKIEIITPLPHFSQVFKILKKYKVVLNETKSLSSQKFLLLGEAPLKEIIGGNFYEELKGRTKGYASFSFQTSDFKKADLVKLNILVAGKEEEAFSRIVPGEKAFREGKDFLRKLKEILPPQQFTVPLQAVINGKIIARETIRALRKDVTAPLYGGDFTRRRKLLEIQKKGKKKLKKRAKIRIPSEIFLKMFKS